MDGILESCLRRADFHLQSLFRIRQELAGAPPAGVAGSGPLGAADWARHRQSLTGPFREHEDRYASDAAYLRYLESIREAKVLAAESLARAFPFGRYRRVLELGCGDMPQAWVVSRAHPALEYTATDFDPRVIEACSRLPLLASIRKAVVDAAANEIAALADVDLVLSWSLEFSLDDAELARLFSACASRSLPYLMCTHTAIGPIAGLSWKRARARRRLARGEPGWRRLGWLRSEAELARIAGASGLALEWKGYHVNHSAFLFAP